MVWYVEAALGTTTKNLISFDGFDLMTNPEYFVIRKKYYSWYGNHLYEDLAFSFNSFPGRRALKQIAYVFLWSYMTNVLCGHKLFDKKGIYVHVYTEWL